MRTATNVRKITASDSMLISAYYLIDYYASDLKEFRVILSSGDCIYDWRDGEPLIVWRPLARLHSLLHEIAHHRLKHRNNERRAIELIQEAEAWLWAERRARMHDVPFDYEDAALSFTKYMWKSRKRGPVVIDWRFKDGRKEARAPKVLRDPKGSSGSS